MKKLIILCILSIVTTLQAQTINRITVDYNDYPTAVINNVDQSVVDAINKTYPVNNPIPTEVKPSTQPYINSIRVGSKETVKTIDQLKPLLKDSTAIYFDCGETFNYDLGITTSGRKHIIFTSENSGAKPILIFKSPNPAGRYPVAISCDGTDITVDGLSFAAGDSNNTVGVGVAGTQVLVENCTSLCGASNGAGFKVSSTHDVTFINCVGYGYYGLWIGKGPLPEYQTPLNKNIVIRGCSFTASSGGHCERIQMSDGILNDGNTYTGPARDGITIHECNNIIVRNCNVVNANIGIGPLSKGNYTTLPAGPNKNFCLALTCSNVLIENCKINLDNPTAITWDIGTVNAQVVNNVIITPVQSAVNVSDLDGRYPKRLVGTGIVSGNSIHGPPGTVAVKAPAGAKIIQSNNIIN